MSTLSETGTSPQDLAGIAEEVARAAGRLIREQRPTRVEVAGTKTSQVDVVTQMDLASEALIRAELARLRPGDGMLGEEDGLIPGTSGLTWVVDPIDGTVNYLYGIPAYAVSVAVVSGEPVPGSWQVEAGCVHAVADGRTWTAARGRGARLDGRRLEIGPAAPLASALVGTGFGYRSRRRREQARVLTEVLPRVRDVRRIGSAALDLCAVASGQLNAYFERGLQPWDLAAGALVAQEAGATVSGLRGEPAGEVMTVAASPATHEALVALLESVRADAEELPDATEPAAAG
ncbi:inositol monophosphatase family protein [Cellulomonas bogoriensis]|uniref:Inositol-1-monophosphatase n=1 Tax=Cellulomonas bogoriensis 69B4 = DSM 16987 TaxID=1386082 RepID=A0A0A0C4L9_9CELL|nr:inositol monophosphatase family protein [Cellulomonas bogoriensis]KGM14279.1 inositol-phosphate phosphatase [Cellulomonas bogoriensis 69B4 = DSM 16987]